MPFKVPGRQTLSPRQTQLQHPLGAKGEECPAWKGGQRATASGCHTLPGRVPVTRPPPYPGTWSPESPVAGALGALQPEPSLDQVLQERDEALAKKQAVEAELDTCRARLQAVEAQLLEVLEEKLRLRQEVEAWEEDMQQLVAKLVQGQLQSEARGTQGAHGDAGSVRSRAQLPQGRRVQWW
ncbi:BICD family-like cargo adapter 1 [Fukomys damarensis]|uniref:BICD family-like cargo adapter 1 n=1 Tax=Fukomys damarensis TaxID=885580 RepID=UPI0014556218|nr:BICD family-like cargo adapter 1 [Fukomys damarensis]